MNVNNPDHGSYAPCIFRVNRVKITNWSYTKLPPSCSIISSVCIYKRALCLYILTSCLRFIACLTSIFTFLFGNYVPTLYVHRHESIYWVDSNFVVIVRVLSFFLLIRCCFVNENLWISLEEIVIFILWRKRAKKDYVIMQTASDILHRLFPNAEGH